MEDLLIHKAIIFAAVKHKNQKRKGTDIPYIVHPMEVMQILTENGCSEDVIIAGLLHDTLEDTQTAPDEIEKEFGKKILDIVLTESEDKSKTWKERKQHTIDTLRNESLETKLVCCADKLSNIKSIYFDYLAVGNDIWKRFNAGKEDIEWYYRGIAQALKGSLGKYKMYAELTQTIEKVFPG